MANRHNNIQFCLYRAYSVLGEIQGRVLLNLADATSSPLQHVCRNDHICCSSALSSVFLLLIASHLWYSLDSSLVAWFRGLIIYMTSTVTRMVSSGSIAFFQSLSLLNLWFNLQKGKGYIYYKYTCRSIIA